jgi:CheY-like chemotaxis protein
VLPACPDRPAGLQCWLGAGVFSDKQGCGVVGLWCGEPSITENLTPASTPQAALEPQQSPAPRPGVLVADDEPLLLAVLNSGLQQRGFTVWLASNGLQALDVYRSHAKDIAVVLLDVRMPGLDGPRTLAALRRLNPTVRCCFMTGNMGLYTPEELLALGAVQVFPKPFDLPQLAEALWQLASRGSPSTEDRQAGGASVVSGS